MLHFSDISVHNTFFNADVYKNAGHNLIIIKATEGATYVNERWEGWVKDARRAGLRVGHYHFASIRDSADQATHFLNVVNRNYRNDDILVLDLEKASLPAARRGALARDFLDRVPGEKWLYSGIYYLQEGGVKPFGTPLWLASYTDTWRDSLLPHGWDKQTLVAWQYTSTGSVSGIGRATGGVDYNEWYPTRAQPANRFHGYPVLRQDARDPHRSTGFPDRSAPVQTLQRALNRALKRQEGTPEWLNPDGDFGPVTHQVVLHYQQEKALAADGVVGSLTWSSLDSALDAEEHG
ncbi:GH25 family lysozyme [Parafrankia sp. EUN1f]|uniref:GH25 family lysozyme n=1 Tax=Parafrankia sp. EUN1f TaxID=102897 RepID=UPI0001C4512A|nr:GH25 family lysozyme [Parafrankia sp. EUN1f]EFC85000.1 glycoside hydrolase family 25 [Parafrankia sp. EUN1f]